MRKKITFITALLFLFSSTELHEFAKLPYLIAHFSYHHSITPSLSFSGFIKLHYAGNHPADQDETEDNKLPFNSGKDISHTDISTLNLKVPAEKLPALQNSDIKISSDGIPCHRHYPIFHPPRHA